MPVVSQGFVDNRGNFHPIRASSGYSPQVERQEKKHVGIHRHAHHNLRVSPSRIPPNGRRREGQRGAASALRRKIGLRIRREHDAGALRGDPSERELREAGHKGPRTNWRRQEREAIPF